MRQNRTPERLLLSCFACDPTKGSECFVGWNWPKEIYSDLTKVVITRRFHREILEAQDLPNTTFAYFDLPFCSGMGHHHPLMKLYYMLWQIAVLPYAMLLAFRHKVTLVQHVTYNTMDFPGLLWAIPGTRFIWGSIGGGQVPPAALRGYYGAEWDQQKKRAIVKKLAWANPLIRLALLRAELVFAANSDTYRRLAALMRNTSRLHRVLETALHEAGSPRTLENKPVRLIWVGRFETRKAPRLAVEIARELEIRAPGRFFLEMVGEGDLWDNTLALAVRHRNVTVRPPVAFSEMERIYEASDILLFTSLQDTSGNVVLEAMGKGMPVVALNHHGSADMLARGGGRLVPIGSPVEVIDHFCKALLSLSDPDAYADASRAAICNIEENYLWSSKRKTVRRLLDRSLTTAADERVPA